MKKFLALVLALVMCLGLGSLLAGCEGGGKTIDKGNILGGATIDGTNLRYEEKFTIDYWLPDNTDLDIEGCYADKLIEATINCDLKVTEYEARDQYETLVAQKKIPALTFANAHIFGPAYGPLGAYIDWNDYIDAMPNVKKAFESETFQREIDRYTLEDGSMYHLPCPQTGFATNVGWLYRKDIFDKHGMTFPTNQDELMATLRKLKELYPNSYPFVLRGLNGANLGGLMNMAQLFGESYIGYSSYNTLFSLDTETQTYYLAQTSDAMRECLIWLNDLYEEGLLHPSCITLDNAQWTEAFASNTSFIGYDKMDRIDMLTMGAIDANPNYVLTGARNFPMGSNTDATFSEPSSGFSLLVSGLLEPEELEQVLKYVDWLFSEEGIQITNWGKEGESYEQLADGTYDFKEDFTYEGSGLGVNGVCAYRDFEIYLKSQQPHVIEAIDEIAKDYVETDKKGFRLEYESDEQRIFDMYYQKTYDLCNARHQEFILGPGKDGKDPSGADWDAFVQEVNDSLPAEMMQIHKDALERYFAKHPEDKK